MSTQNQIAVIDTQVQDYQVLEQAAREAGLEVILLSGQGDGVVELAQALEGRSGIEALHIFSHGSSGEVLLGSTSLNSAVLAGYMVELGVIPQALNEQGEILIYGCEVAKGEVGRQFIETLSAALNRPVAAASHKVGHADLNGTWGLDHIPTYLGTQPLAVPQWHGAFGVPTLLTANSTPTDDGVMSDGSANIVLKFSENVKNNGESSYIEIYDSNDNSIELFSPAGWYSFSGTGNPAGSATIAGDTIRINPGSDLSGGGYYLRIFGGNLVSVSTNEQLAPITDSTTYNFTVNSNTTPAFANLDGAPTFTEDGSASVLDNDVTVADTELDALNSGNGDYSGASLTIARHGGAEAQDVFGGSGLLGTLTEGQSFNYDGMAVGTVTTNSAGTLKLTFNASATSAIVDSVLQAIAYANTSNNPPASVTLDWTFNDGTADTSGTNQTTVTVNAVNDDPTILGLTTDITVKEDTASNVDLSAATFSDMDSGGSSITLTIAAGAGTLSSTSAGGVTIIIGGSGGGTITLIGTASNIDTFLNTASNIKYTGASNANGDNVTTLTLTANDGGNTGTGGGGNVTLGTVNVDITAVNDVPVITNLDGDSASFAVGTNTAVKLDSGTAATVTDADHATFGENGYVQVSSSGSLVTAAGNLSFDGSTVKAGTDGVIAANENVTVSGTAIGSVDATEDGQDGEVLTISFNNSATPALVSTLLQNLYYTESNDLNGARTFLIRVNDGADTSADATVTLTGGTPSLTSATFDWQTGAVVLTGENFVAQDGAANDIVANKLTFSVAGGDSYTLTDTANVEITDATSATLTLSATDLLNVQGILDYNGTANSSSANFNLAVADDWLAGAAALDLAEANNTVTVSNLQTPTITSATYNTGTGVLTVTGTHLFKKLGDANDIDASAFTLTGEGGATYILTDTADVEITSATSFTLTLSATDKTKVNALLNKDGTESNDNTTYNLAAADDWLAGADANSDIADTSNGITVTLVSGGGGGGGGGSPAAPQDPDPIIPATEDWDDLPNDDGDDIPDAVEDLAPPPEEGGIQGDGNGDGTPDSEQEDVASVPIRDTDAVSLNPNAPVVFATLVGGSSDDPEGGAAPVPSGGVIITSVFQGDAPAAEGRGGIDMPLGLIGFEANAEVPEGNENAGDIPFSLLIETDAETPINGFWKQDSTGGWVNLASADYGGRVTQVGNKVRLDFVIEDNGPFDTNPNPGAISDPGAPGWAVVSYFDDEFLASQGTSFTGGPGRDMLFLPGALSESQISRGTPAVVWHGGESESLSSVEVLLFGGGAFDESAYLQANPDVAAAVDNGRLGALEHYLRFGYSEGRAPNAEGRLPQVSLSTTAFDDIGLDTTYYLEQNPDVAAAVARGQLSSARQHFDLFGGAEGRDPNALFDTDWYLAHNPDVAAAVSAGAITTAYAHYLGCGGHEGRAASDAFASGLYLLDYPDVQAAGMNPLLHFLSFGIEEGRHAQYIGAEVWL